MLLHVDFTVLIDTGSTDLWVNTTGRSLKLTNSTDLEVTIGYGQGGVDGNIAFAELMIGDFVVPSQGMCSCISFPYPCLLAVPSLCMRQPS